MIPDPRSWLSLFLVKSSANFAKKIQELAEDKAENPRTCRGQSREQNPYERLQENSNPSKLYSSKLLSLSQPSLLQKLWAAVLPPRGVSIKYINASVYMGPKGPIFYMKIKKIIKTVIFEKFGKNRILGQFLMIFGP